ncbi:ABC transporter ATP-binding protein [Neobacillus sp. MER 74]|uniref:ABC transporter ATP-binding protein n=1 Tax=Neobacillus sp. MER 74 TaxID=2939566 RepID=UPI002041D032|nr:ABC transporter ATP-binding protein [Neobacillus sp. MER 74]MCM3113765.1 ABC transporter ATP-binding protein [Neobacillus sp. MER 74]
MLNVNNLHVSYGAIKALQGVSIEINRGECVAIVGSNGAGKTTLLKTICGLLTPNQGSVELDGKPLVGKKAYEIANLAIAHVPEGRRVFTEMSVLDNLILGSYVKEAKAHRNENLDYVFSLFPRLAERKSQLAGTMSGGEQQMLAVARGLMLKPKLIILDEPSSGLSPLIVEQMYEKLAEIHKSTDMAMLVVEQNVPIALSIANRGYVLENGSIHVSGTSNQLMVDPEVKAAYLGFH